MTQLPTSRTLQCGRCRRRLFRVGLFALMSSTASRMAACLSKVHRPVHAHTGLYAHIRPPRIDACADFLECMVRMATAISMPTQLELESSGAPNVYEYFQAGRDGACAVRHGREVAVGLTSAMTGSSSPAFVGCWPTASGRGAGDSSQTRALDTIHAKCPARC